MIVSSNLNVLAQMFEWGLLKMLKNTPSLYLYNNSAKDYNTGTDMTHNLNSESKRTNPYH